MISLFFKYKNKHMDKKINNNGHKYVDLGLPSGTLWATMNVGASKPTDGGLYFQWGDTKGYTKEQVGTGDGKKKFYWPDYKWNPSGDGKTFTKYASEGATLELEDDAANVNMGGDWHMPTDTQIRELFDNTTNTWTEQNYVKGRLFTSKKDNSKSIFIPVAGITWFGLILASGGYGGIWSSVLNVGNANYGQCLYFSSRYINLHGDYRDYGFTVRGVIG
jgi:hypothetical protein